MALSDLPAWSVAKAVHRWARGEVPAYVEKAPNYAFTPAPQTIRALSLLELGYAKLALAQARKVAGVLTFEQAMDPVLDSADGSGSPMPRLRKM